MVRLQAFFLTALSNAAETGWIAPMIELLAGTLIAVFAMGHLTRALKDRHPGRGCIPTS